MVEGEAREGRSWPCGATAQKWLTLLLLWVFHVCEASPHLPATILFVALFFLSVYFVVSVCLLHAISSVYYCTSMCRPLAEE